MSELMFGQVLTETEMRRRTSAVWPYVHFKPGTYIEPAVVDTLMDGLIDIHVHGAPAGSWLPGRPTVVHSTMEASKEKVAALVFKDHYTMTNNWAQMINESLQLLKEEKGPDSGFTPTKLYGGIVLNYAVGGLNPEAVKICLGYGDCVEVWLPSTSSRYQLDLIAKELGTTNDKGGVYVSENGVLLPEMVQILDMMAEYNDNAEGKRVALSACHVSNEEKFDLLHYVKDKGMDVDIIIDHITQELTIATEEQMLEMIDLGAYLEFAETSCIPWTGMEDQVINFDWSMYIIKKMIEKRGTDHLVLCSDSGQPSHEFVPGWRCFLKTLLAKGISYDDVKVMCQDIPRKLTGIK